MRKVLFFLLLSTCTRISDHPTGRLWGVTEREPVQEQPYVQVEGDTVAYVLAVEYPEGAPWQMFGEYSACHLSVFASQKKIISVPAGEGTSLVPSTDRNRLVGGHLYSYSFVGVDTIIYKDGEELFRYPFWEFLRGFAVTPEGVYTLGQGASYDGFSLRLDGLELFSRSSGTIVGEEDFTARSEGALFRTDEYFSFGYMSTDGDFYIVRDLFPEVVSFQDDVDKVLDFKYIDNEYYVVALRPDGRLGVYAGGKRKIVFDLNDSKAICSACLLSQAGRIFLKAHFRLPDSGERLYVWDLRGNAVFRSETSVWLYMEDASLFWYGFPGDDWEYDGAAKIPLSSVGDRLYSQRCAVLRDGHRYAAVTATDNMMYPYLLRDGRRLAIAVNGYLIDIEVIP